MPKTVIAAAFAVAIVLGAPLPLWRHRTRA